uniref:Uncharacterized protein n=1 Tax=Myotis myotis TaxID=51298 RepID=A0A7J7XH95_MYOMY|nr:hypothetical protein mMyoMyo1_011635 [Myotis myotis]
MARLLRASCLFSLLLAGLVPSLGQEKSKTDCHAGVSGTIYEYGALTLNGEEYIPFKQYAGKYVLFVNCPEVPGSTTLSILPPLLCTSRSFLKGPPKPLPPPHRAP